jgi:hypothetical protein
MAIHRRVRKAARDTVAHVRRHGQAVRARLQGRRKGRRLARSAETSGLNERLSPLAAHIRSGQYYEASWQLFRFGQFKGLSDEEATLALAAWARKQRISVQFDVRRVGSIEVLFVILSSMSQ